MGKTIKLIALVLCLSLNHSAFATDLYAGARAPDFEGIDILGERHALADYKGEIVVLEWSSPQCPYSRRYYKNGVLPELHSHSSKKGIVWINIVPKMHGETQPDLNKLDPGSSKITIYDHNLDISTSYGAGTTPEIFVIDRTGMIAYMGAIDSSALLKKTSSEVRPYVRNALDDLLAGRAVAKKVTRPYGCYVENNSYAADTLPSIEGAVPQVTSPD